MSRCIGDGTARHGLARSDPLESQWTFLTNHAHVLLCIAGEPDVRLRDVAARVGITERAAQHIVADLVAAGYLSRRRAGRRNVYQIHAHLPLRHPLEERAEVGALLSLLVGGGTWWPVA